MNAAALSVYETLRREGTQRELVHERDLDRYK
jgi:hypothetical protein